MDRLQAAAKPVDPDPPPQQRVPYFAGVSKAYLGYDVHAGSIGNTRATPAPGDKEAADAVGPALPDQPLDVVG